MLPLWEEAPTHRVAGAKKGGSSAWGSSLHTAHARDGPTLPQLAAALSSCVCQLLGKV